MVVRYRIDGGLTDALGELTERNSVSCAIATRAGIVIIKYDDVQLAKAVPPPPARRARQMRQQPRR